MPTQKPRVIRDYAGLYDFLQGGTECLSDRKMVEEALEATCIALASAPLSDQQNGG